MRGTEGFDGRGYDIAESYTGFFLTAFFANIIILNIGLAIIGDTYAFIIEHIDWLEKIGRLGTIAGWSPHLNRTSSKDERRFFLYHVRVIDGIMAFDDRSLWAGRVNEVTTATERQISSVRQTLTEKHTQLLNTIERYAQRDQHDDGSIRKLIKTETDQTQL